MRKQPQKYCYKHHNDAAVAHCRQCQRPLCMSCAVRMSDQIFCSEQCGARYEEFMLRWKEEKKPRSFKWVWNVVLLIAAIVMFLVAVKLGASKNVPFFVKIHEKLFSK